MYHSVVCCPNCALKGKNIEMPVVYGSDGASFNGEGRQCPECGTFYPLLKKQRHNRVRRG